MANGVNKWIGVGNVTKDPEVRQAGETSVCTIRIACNERMKKAGEWVDHAEFVDVVCWGKTAENVGEYVRKGKQVYVEGKLRTRQYKDKEGVERYRTEVNADQVLFLGGGGGDRTDSQRTSGGSRSTGENRHEAVNDTPQRGAAFIDDDLPF